MENEEHDVNSADLRVFALRLSTLHQDVSTVKTSIDNLTNAVSKLAIVEERQSQMLAMQNRLLSEYDKQDVSLQALTQRVLIVESKQEDSKKSEGKLDLWMDRLTWATVAAISMYMAKKTGFIT
jgi:hypothetical protein